MLSLKIRCLSLKDEKNSFDNTNGIHFILEQKLLKHKKMLLEYDTTIQCDERKKQNIGVKLKVSIIGLVGCHYLI
jgi:hypothetical protein